MSPAIVDVACLKVKLARAHEGANLHTAPPLTKADLDAFERTSGVALPDDYARFLLEVGDGGSGPPAYGLYSLDEAVTQSEKGIYSFADAFEPPRSEHDLVDLEAPGMLLLGHQGCGYWDGLVVAGPERGTVWTFVEVRPGWIPIVDGRALRTREGKAFVRKDDYAEYYGVALSEVNRGERMSFSRYYERWLDRFLPERGATPDA